MHSRLLAATAVCLIASAGPVAAQGAQDTTSRRQNEAPARVQDRPPEPANPMPEGETPPDVSDYQTPKAPGTEATPGPAPGVPATPPGAPETPSTSPATTPDSLEPSAGGRLQPLEAYLDEEGESRLKAGGDRREQLVGKPVIMPSGEQAGTINEFVVRDGRNYAHLTLPKTPGDRQREVVAPYEMLSVSPQGDRVMIQAQSRDELKKLPQFLPESFQPIR